MRYNNKPDDNSHKTVSGEKDPLLQLPQVVTDQIMDSTHDLTIYLGERANFFKRNAKEVLGSDKGVDFSTCALIERLAFYETMINSLIGVTKLLEERLGGVEGSDSN